jgi:hypothetical protein
MVKFRGRILRYGKWRRAAWHKFADVAEERTVSILEQFRPLLPWRRILHVLPKRRCISNRSRAATLRFILTTVRNSKQAYFGDYRRFVSTCHLPPCRDYETKMAAPCSSETLATRCQNSEDHNMHVALVSYLLLLLLQIFAQCQPFYEFCFTSWPTLKLEAVARF